MPTFQVVPDCYLRGLGPGYLPRGGYVCTTVSSPETAAQNKPDLIGVKLQLRVEYAYPVGDDGKFGAVDPNLANREFSVNIWYPKADDNARHGISAMVSVLVAYGRYTKEEGKHILATPGTPFDFGPGMFDGKRVCVLCDPPPADAGPDAFPETDFAIQDEFRKVIANEMPYTWRQDKKSSRRQAAVAANANASSTAAGLVNTPATIPTPRPASAPAPTGSAPTFAAVPPTAPPPTPTAVAPAQWSPGAPPAPTFAAPPPAGNNGAGPATWPTAPTSTPSSAPPAPAW